MTVFARGSRFVWCSMNTFAVRDDKSGHVTGFEIDSAYISPRQIERLLGRLEGVSDIALVGAFGSGTDLRVRFRFKGTSYLVLEPFGDNSRYLITPEVLGHSAGTILEIEEWFTAHELPFWRKVVGDIMTMRPIFDLFQRERSRSR